MSDLSFNRNKVEGVNECVRLSLLIFDDIQKFGRLAINKVPRDFAKRDMTISFFGDLTRINNNIKAIKWLLNRGINIIEKYEIDLDKKIDELNNSVEKMYAQKQVYEEYRIQRGDTLWVIAKKYLGDGNRYKELAEYNNIKNPDLIQVGDTLIIPNNNADFLALDTEKVDENLEGIKTTESADSFRKNYDSKLAFSALERKYKEAKARVEAEEKASAFKKAYDSKAAFSAIERKYKEAKARVEAEEKASIFKKAYDSKLAFSAIEKEHEKSKAKAEKVKEMDKDKLLHDEQLRFSEKETEEINRSSISRGVNLNGLKNNYDTNKSYRLTSYWTGDSPVTTHRTGSGKTTAEFKINDKGWYTYNGKLVLAAATNELLNSNEFGRGAKEHIPREGRHYFNYGDEIAVTIDNVTYDGIILDSCGASMWVDEDRIDLFVASAKHKIDRGYRGENSITVHYNK